MTTISTRSTKFHAPLSFLSLTAGAFRAWHQVRRDRRILDNLGPELLKDIGYRRLPSGDYGRD